ncbi:MAG TPA: VRR-NUC domain-containing protein [Desulfobacterales bacterium]|nr:VRR-NUC domain-containing protein [Desulfobacterales bacterium]
MKQTEAEITKAIRNMLRILGVFHWKNFSGPMQHPKGISDILGIWKGRFLAIEVKTETGLVSDHQKEFLRNVNLSGGIGFVARSIDVVIDQLGVKDRFF